MKRNILFFVSFVSFIIISCVFVVIGFIVGANVNYGVPAMPYVQSYFRNVQDKTEYGWILNGTASSLLKRHLMVWDPKYNRFAIFPDYSRNQHSSMITAKGELGIDSTNNIQYISINWTNGSISVDIKNSYIFYLTQEKTLADFNHDGIWDTKIDNTNKWYFVKGHWHPKVGENKYGSIVGLDGTNYNIKYSKQGELRFRKISKKK